MDVAHFPVSFDEVGLEVFLDIVPFLNCFKQLRPQLGVTFLEFFHLLLFHFYLLLHVVNLQLESIY